MKKKKLISLVLAGTMVFGLFPNITISYDPKKCFFIFFCYFFTH